MTRSAAQIAAERRRADKTKSILIRLSPDDHATLAKLAGEQSPTAYVTSMVLRAIKRAS